MTEEQLRRWLLVYLARTTGVPVEQLQADRPVQDFGVSSRDAVALAGELGKVLGKPLPATLAWQNPTIASLAASLAGQQDSSADAVHAVAGEPIAVIGMGCRLAGGIESPAQLWQLLTAGEEAVGQVPEGRWENFAPAEMLSRLPRRGGFLDDVAGFDAGFFGITPREAALMDPQQRILLEVAWAALEHAGIAPSSLRGSRTGVFVGSCSSEYGVMTMTDLDRMDAWTGTGAAASIIANRLSYQLDLRGPSVVIDTACSSSLVAVHQAVRSLQHGETGLAVAAGVNLLLSPGITANFQEAGLLAADGRCKTFDASADGIVRAEGCGVVLLKRLADARRDGDRVLAVIRATASNSDGRSNGLMAPNPASQESLLREVYAAANLNPSAIDYVEAHGTGTLLGDPIEAHALGTVLGSGREAERPLLIGSVKSNLGHLEGAAGIVGLIKVVLGLGNGSIPASRNFQRPNPHIPFDQLALRVVTEATEWPRYSGLAHAGVSAFGFGGTNAHVVLEEWPQDLPSCPIDEYEPQVFAVSAQSGEALRQRATELADWLDSSEVPLPEVAGVLAGRRDHLRIRAAVVATDRLELGNALRALEGTPSTESADVVFVYSGYGSQWPEMGRRLFATEPAFVEAVDDLDPLFQWEAGFSLRQVLEGGLDLPDIATLQPALFGVQLALTALWRSHGVEPTAVIGQSMGEVTAAVVAGALDVADGLRIMVVRAELLARVEQLGGAMAVVELSEQEIAEQFPGLAVAVYASPNQCTVTGDDDQITALVDQVGAMGRLARKLNFSVAGHSPAVDGLLAELTERLTDLRPHEPSIPCYTTVLADPRQVPHFTEAYWVANLRQPVRLAQAIGAAVADGHTRFLEISPHPVAVSAIEQTADAAAVLALPTLRRDVDEQLTFLTSLAKLHVGGHPTALVRRYPSAPVVDLPGPCWQHEKHWAERSAGRGLAPGGHPFLGAHVELPEGERHVWQADVGTEALPWLADHQVHGVPILPGTAYLEMALSAGRQVFGDRVVVRNLELHQVLPLTAHTDVTISLRLNGEVSIHGRSEGGRWVQHATATVVVADPDVVLLLPEVATPLELDLYGTLAEVGQQYGPAFRGLSELKAAGGRASARISLPREARSYQGCGLHPALADACLHTLAAAAVGDLVGVYLPMVVGSVQVLGDPTQGTRCNAELLPVDGQALIGAVQLLDDNGNVLVDIADVYVRRLSRSSVPVPLADKTYEVRWEATEPPPDPDTGPRTWVLFSDGELEHAIEAAWLTSRLAEHGDRLVWASGDGLHELDTAPDGVLVVAGNTDDPQEARRTVLAVAGIVRRLTSLAGQPPRLWLITRDDSSCLRALVRVLAFEHPELRATIVCLEPDSATDDLLTELHADGPDDEVAWRSGTRYTARLTRAVVGEPVVNPVVRPGAYVITGGLGTLGLLVAGWLADRGARRVVLCGRTDRDVDSVRAKGIEVELVLGDIADPGVAERAVTAATATGLPLHGVLHGAMVLDDHTVMTMGAEDLDRVWRPKVLGGVRLHEATEHLDLDWWLVFSSAAGVFGSPGQAAYATANAWLDAFVLWRRSNGLPATTINWGPWGDDRNNPVLEPLGMTEGLDALEAVLASGRDRTTVTRLTIATTMELFPELAGRPFLAELAVVPTDCDDWVPSSPRSREQVLDRLKLRIAGLMGANPDRIDVTVPLTQLGLDSLMAMRARGTVERDFGVKVPIPLLLKGASITDIAEHLLGGSPAAVKAEPWRHQEENLGSDGPVTTLRAGGDRPPLFLFHAAGGPTSVYRPLVDLLGDSQPCYGFERLDEFDSVRERASQYVKMLREIQPVGPYRLAGWSFGGCLAYEAACQLTAEGDRVDLVTLIDSILPLPTTTPTEQLLLDRYARFADHIRQTYGVRFEIPADELARLDEHEQLTFVMTRLADEVPGIGSAVLRHQYTSYVDARLAERYRPEPYTGRVLLLRADQPHPVTTTLDPRYLRTDEALGWDEWCADLTVARVPGDHVSMIDPPHVQVIASHLARALATAESRMPL